MEGLNGQGGCLNANFNTDNIYCTPLEAISTFVSCALVIGNYAPRKLLEVISMPGTNILASENSLTPPASSLWERVQKGMLHCPDYSFQKLFKDPLLHVGFTAYASYPKTVVETEEHFVVLEGMIYNADFGHLRAELQSVARQLGSSIAELVDSLARFLNRMDGEFVVSAFDKRRNDWWCSMTFWAGCPCFTIWRRTPWWFRGK